MAEAKKRLKIPSDTLADRIHRELEHKILSGLWAAGHRIPSEQELTGTYNCSRMTVSQAIGRLAAAGLVTRNRRAGTVVRRPKYQASVSQLHDIGREIRESGKTYAYRCLALTQDPAGGFVQITCLHLADGMPLVHEERVINLATVSEAADVDFTQTAPGSWLIAKVPWSEAENKVSAINADIVLAQHLEIPPGSACLLVERETWLQSNRLTQVRQAFPGDAYHLIARFKPSR